MGVTAFNRYMRICKSDQQYKKLFSPWKSRILLASIWIFVACYTVVPRLAGLQAYAFIPGYALCGPAHLSETGKNDPLRHCSHFILVSTVNNNNN